MKKYNYSFNSFLENEIAYPSDIDEIKKLTKKNYTIVGNLRSYNDCAIGQRPFSIKKLNNLIEFDELKGEIEVEAGMIIKNLVTIILEKSFIIKSLPGTRYATVGGIIANNTQGKNIHNTYILDHTLSLKVLHNSKIHDCSRNKNSDLFFATLGGKGSTGVILSARFKLSRIKTKNILLQKYFFKNLIDMQNKFLILKEKYEYIVCWVDNLSSNKDYILFCANHSTNNKVLERRTELQIPNFVINIFNQISHKKVFTYLFNFLFKLNNKIRKIILYEIFDFFFIQDTLVNWNHVFKKKGFIQFQFEIKFNELNYILNKLKKIEEKLFFTNFMIIKFKYIDSEIYSTVSLDIPLNNNFEELKKKLIKFSEEESLLISLSKDVLLKNINTKTKNKNFFLNNKKFMDSNSESSFLNRINYKN